MLLLGDDGALQFDLGNGLQCSAEITSYRLLLSRDLLETTAQGQESRSYAPGLKSWSGECNMNVRLAQDGNLFTIAQLVPAILALEDEALVPARFYIQSHDAPSGCPPGVEIGPAWFEGTAILSEITLDIADPTTLIRGAARFTGTGPIEFKT